MKYIICIIAVISLFSCTVDYNPDVNQNDIQRHLIVNSYLSPQQTIKIEFYSTVTSNNTYPYKGQNNISILLKENGNVLYDGMCADSIFTLNYLPKAGCTYSITASVVGLSTIYAETKIPYPIACKINYKPKYGIITLQDFQQETENSSMWITANYMIRGTVSQKFDEYMTNAVLADAVNKSNDTFFANEILGTSYCDGFIRVKSTNLLKLDSLMFSDTRPNLKSSAGYTSIRVRLCAASTDYDQYNKTYYQQTATPAESDMNAMVYQPTHIYCNIKNGLGIFAGLNESFYYIYK